jgi:hypothetical protein
MEKKQEQCKHDWQPEDKNLFCQIEYASFDTNEITKRYICDKCGAVKFIHS